MSQPSPNPLLDAALGYAARGWRVVPLHSVDVRGCSCGQSDCSPGKHPRTKHGLKDGTTDPETIRGWWLKWPRANVGVVCGPESNVWMVGPDGQAGIDDLAALEAGRERVEAAAAARSQGGGQHFLFAWPADGQPIPNRKNHRGRKIDVRAFGDGPGYFVAPPSVGEKGRYEWIVPPPAGALLPAPDWLVEWARGTDPKPDPAPAAGTRTPTPAADPTKDELHKRAVRYLERCPEAVSGQRGHDALFWAARALVWGFALPEHEALALLATFYNPRCKPAWAEKDLQHKVRDAAAKPFGKERGFLRAVADPDQAVRALPPPARSPVAAKPADWPEPVPLRSAIAAPAFPLDAFPVWLGEFCASVAAQTNVPVGYPAANVLGVAAGAVGATLSVALTPEWTERACLYVAVVAPKSAGKTPAHLAALKPLRRLQAERTKADEAADRDKGKRAVLFTTDTTVEGVGRLLAAHPRGLLLAADELSGFVQAMDQYKAGGKGNDRAFWLSCWAGTTVSILRKSADAPHLWVSHPCVSVLGGVQPAVLADVFGTDDGLAERFLFECSDPLPAGRAVRGDYRHAADWAAKVKELTALGMVDGEFGPRPFAVPITDAAWEVFADWTAAVAGGPDRDTALDGFRAKAKGYAARLALVLHALTAVEPNRAVPAIDAAGMAAGVTLMRYYLAQVERVRAGAGAGQSDAERVLAWLARCGQSAVTRRDVHRGLLRQFPKAEQLADPLRRLVQHGWLRYADAPSSGGRKAEAVYELRPDLCQRCQHLSARGADGSSAGIAGENR